MESLWGRAHENVQLWWKGLLGIRVWLIRPGSCRGGYHLLRHIFFDLLNIVMGRITSWSRWMATRKVLRLPLGVAIRSILRLVVSISEDQKLYVLLKMAALRCEPAATFTYLIVSTAIQKGPDRFIGDRNMRGSDCIYNPCSSIFWWKGMPIR